MPALFRAYSVAGMGADNMNTGSPPRTLRWWMRARGVSPCAFTAAFSEATSMAAPASLIWLDDGGGDPARRVLQRLEGGHLLERLVSRREAPRRR